MKSKEILTAPKVNAKIPSGVIGKPFTGGAFMLDMMEKELWQPVEGFEDYLISTYGNIVSLKCKVGYRVLHPSDNGHGYRRIALWRNGKGYYKRMGRLVAITFIPNPENKPEVNHKDCNKKNDHYKNLEWCTRKEHEEHTISNKLHPTGINAGGHKLTEKQVRHIRYIYNKYKPLGFVSQRSMAKDYGVCQSTIGYILRNQTWKNIQL